MDSVVTPVDVDALDKLLRETCYDNDQWQFLVDSFRNGFPLGYDGDKQVKMRSPNLRLECGTKSDLWNKVMKEVKIGSFAGPFEKIPFQHYIQSPLGLVPKGQNDLRLIFHLSHPRGHTPKSVNACTPSELCTVKYKGFNNAVKLCIEAGQGCIHSQIRYAERIQKFTN